MKSGWKMFFKKRLLLSVFLPFLLAACSTLSQGSVVNLRALDFVNDDVASMVMAIDVPVSLVPLPGENLFTFSVVPRKGQPRQIVAVLQRADAVDIAATLPPPAQNRGYFLFEFSDADKDAFREMQQWMRKISSGSGEGRSLLSIELTPRFCTLTALDPSRTSYSVLLALPGSNELEPLIAGETISALLEKSGLSQLPLCANIQ